jgi:hypothetical protein
MILAAVVVGLVTAWAYGPRAGASAAVVTFGMFLLAAIFPVASPYIYIVVGLGVAAVSATAARRPRHPLMSRALSLGKMAIRRARNGGPK